MSDHRDETPIHDPAPGAPAYGRPAPAYGAPAYGQPASAYAPSSMSPKVEQQLTAAAHWSPVAAVLLGGMTWMGPLIVLLAGGGRSPRVKKHCYDALNFQITVWLATLAATLVSLLLMLVLVGFVLIWVVPVIPLVALAFHVLAAIKVAGGEDYRYPMTIRFLK
ncbi:DUF4870 domain-containing protein [Arsenicicoccus dermatophilus]|uniref:DUF4870 domain-containing protein n=1 Tax=Arsenicicoccus dermatophilus TaxID=1076331 RepID=UPI003917351B